MWARFSLAFAIFLTGCTASPAHRLVADRPDYLHLPAPCIQVCELRQTGRLPGVCSERDYRRFKSLGPACLIVIPNESRLLLRPSGFTPAQ